MVDYQRKINVEVTFTPQDMTLTSWVWKVNGVQESTMQIFKKTFTSLGVHTVSLEGANTCGNCVPVSTTIEVVESITPPTGAAGEQPPSMLPIILGVAAAAALGIIIIASSSGKK